MSKPAGFIQNNTGGPWQILDGVSYDLPLPMPARVAESDEATQKAWLGEASTAFRHQFGTPYVNQAPFSPATISPLEEWDINTRRNILEQTHLAEERNPLAKAAIAYIKLFVVQKGHNITYRNQEVREVLDRFRDNPENNVRVADGEMLRSLLIDGELFVRYFEGDGTEGAEGEVVIAPLMPWGIQWIKHAPGFIKRVISYRYEIAQDDGTGQVVNTSDEDKDIPAGEVLHVAINRSWYEQRGRPELFSILPYLRSYKEWLENRARQNFWRGALLWWVKLIRATPGQVTAKLAQYKKPPAPGSIAVTNENEEWTQFQSNIGAGDAKDDGRAMRLMVAAGMKLPEYFLADGANANLASATAQQVPALRSFGEFQDIMAEQVWTPIYRRVLEAAIDAGLLPEEIEEQDADGEPIKGPKGENGENGEIKMIPTLEAFGVVYAPLEQDDPGTLVNALAVANNSGWVSDESATALLPWGLDYAVEQRRIDAERQKMMDDMAGGLIPMPPQFGQNGAEEEPEEEPEEA